MIEPTSALLLSALFLLPAAVVALYITRGFRPFPLVRALLRRYRWQNLMYVLLIAVSVGMGIGLLSQERGLRTGTARAAEAFDLVIGAPGSELTLTMAAVFLQTANMPLLDGETYSDIANDPRVTMAAPIAFGDSHLGAPIVGTIADFVTHIQTDELLGRNFSGYDEAVVGAAVPLTVGDRFSPAHGHGAKIDDSAHEGFEIVVVGKLPPSGTPWDKAILVPIETTWEVHGLATGHAYEDGNALGPPFEPSLFPGTPAVIVTATDAGAAYGLRLRFGQGGKAMAVFPGGVLANLYRIMGDVRQAMSVLTFVSQVLVATSVLLGLFILSRLFQKQMYMLRAIGAPRRFVAAVIWWYGASLLALGAALGVAFGGVAALVLSRVITERTDILVTASLGWSEVLLALAFLGGTSILALLPAASVLRRPLGNSLRD